ncbi:hypothetical protein TKK_0016367 [Trichogramma kaykai]|uniref:Peptidase S1 domain-containing protein n=1 Tax=Trichogramma kaykai TaxID=54128 RepID=A0ABD2W6N0_9HYME
MKVNKVEIYAGTNQIDDPKAQVHTAQAFIIHPEYHSSALMFNKTNSKYANLMVNDIALIRLKEDIQFTKVIRPVKLPRSNYHLNEVAVVTGWGNMGYRKPMSKFLRATQQKIISWKSCDRQWQLKYLKYIDKGMMCAITYNHEQASGPYPGDSGGPFVDRKGYQIGIISFGYECGTTHLLPDVYVNVWEYINRISNGYEIMRKYNFISSK